MSGPSRADALLEPPPRSRCAPGCGPRAWSSARSVPAATRWRISSAPARTRVTRGRDDDARRITGVSTPRSTVATRGAARLHRFATTRARRSTSSGSTGSPRMRCTGTSAPTASSTRTAALDEHGGGVFALAHFGSWDVAARVRLASGLRITTVMAPVGPDIVTRIAAWARRRQDIEVLVSSNAARALDPRGAARSLRRHPQRHPGSRRDRRRRVLRRQGGLQHRGRVVGRVARRAGDAGRLLAVGRPLPPRGASAGRSSSRARATPR